MLSKKDGHLRISSELVLAPNDSFEKINNLKLGEAQVIRDMGDGYRWLEVKNVKVGGNYFIIAVGFFEDKLRMLQLGFDDKKFELEANWDFWSEKEERRRQLKYKKWVIGELGREGQFSWGDVSASYDPKGGGSAIFVNYDSGSTRWPRSLINKLRSFKKK